MGLKQNIPDDEQFTIHYHNYNSLSKHNFIKDFNRCKLAINSIYYQKTYPAMIGFIIHYGVEYIEYFIKQYDMR